jgi:hypothetical protein
LGKIGGGCIFLGRIGGGGGSADRLTPLAVSFFLC